MEGGCGGGGVVHNLDEQLLLLREGQQAAGQQEKGGGSVALGEASASAFAFAIALCGTWGERGWSGGGGGITGSGGRGILRDASFEGEASEMQGGGGGMGGARRLLWGCWGVLRK